MTDPSGPDSIYESVNAVRAPLVLEMLAYWESKKAGRPLPRPGDIDPTEIPKLIASMVICDLETDPFRVRYRLAGTRQVHILGNELTGRYVDEMNWEEGPFVHRIFAHARDTRAPVFGYYHWMFREGTVPPNSACSPCRRTGRSSTASSGSTNSSLRPIPRLSAGEAAGSRFPGSRIRSCAALCPSQPTNLLSRRQLPVTFRPIAWDFQRKQGINPSAPAGTPRCR